MCARSFGIIRISPVIQENQVGNNFGIFTQPVAVDECRFDFLFDANPANGDPYGCIMGLTGIQVLLLLVNQ